MTKSNLVLREDRGGITSLSLNRPQHGNSLSLETIDALFDHLMALRQEKSIAVIVLRGIGKNIFCAGHDLREFSGKDDPEFFKTVSARCSGMMQAMREQPQIVIARVEPGRKGPEFRLLPSARSEATRFRRAPYDRCKAAALRDKAHAFCR